MKRRRLTRRGSRRLFTALAVKRHPRNVSAPSRGGIRL